MQQVNIRRQTARGAGTLNPKLSASLEEGHRTINNAAGSMWMESFKQSLYQKVELKQPVITSEDERSTSSTRSPDASVLRQQARAQKQPKAEPWQRNLLSGTATGPISAEKMCQRVMPSKTPGSR